MFKITKAKIHKTGNILLFQCLLLFLFFPGSGQTSAYFASQTTLKPRAYMPMVINQTQTSSLMTGIYPVGWPDQTTVDNEMKPLDSWITGVTGGRSTSIFGTFMTILNNNAANVEIPLTAAWSNGYTPFVNLPSPGTAYDIASGRYDSQITAWAKSFKNYASNGQRFAYLAPMQEMNGEWVAYGKDPANFIRAYKHIQSIFAQVGVPAQSVKWVFAPNGWTKLGLPRFENYYPGDAYVDVVAISAYNWGYCKGAKWEEPETVFNNPALGTTNGHYLDRLRAMAPTKPIFIAETASSSYKTSGQKNASEKDRWLRDAYAYLSKQPSVKAVLYFNLDKECDWTAYSKSGVQYQGYRTGINSNGYNYIDPGQLIGVPHTLP